METMRSCLKRKTNKGSYKNYVRVARGYSMLNLKSFELCDFSMIANSKQYVDIEACEKQGNLVLKLSKKSKTDA